MSYNTTIILPYNKDRGYLAEAKRSAEGQGIILPAPGSGSIGQNINSVLDQIITPYWTVMAEDDLLPPGSVFYREKCMEATGADFCHGKGTIFFSDGREMPYFKKKSATLANMLVENQICGGTPMYRTEVIQKFGTWNESLWTAEEYWYHLMLLSKGAHVAWCDRVVYNIRIHDGQKSVGVKDREYQRMRISEVERIKNEFRTPENRKKVKINQKGAKD